MQIHEITEGILKGVYQTGKNTANYFANKILSASDIPNSIARMPAADKKAADINAQAATKSADEPGASPTAVDPLTVPAYQRKGITVPGVNKSDVPPVPPTTTPQQSKVGVGQINKIIPTLRTRDLLSVKKNVDTTLAVKQKQPEPSAITKPQWSGRPQNLTKQQKDYINAIQRNAK